MLLNVLSDNKPLSAKEVVKVSGLDKKRVWDGLYYWWKKGLLLRAEKPTFENQENFKGRRGLTRNTRSYYLYMLKPEGEDSVLISGQKFVSFKKKCLDLRGSRGASKGTVQISKGGLLLIFWGRIGSVLFTRLASCSEVEPF